MYITFKYMLAKTIDLDVDALCTIDESDIVIDELIASHRGVGIEIDDIYVGDEKRDLVTILLDLAAKEATK